MSFLVSLGTSVLAQAKIPSSIVLAPNMSVTLDVPKTGSLHNSNGRAISVRTSGNKIVLTGRQKGVAILTYNGQRIPTQIVERETLEAYEALNKVISRFLHLHSEIEAGNLSIKGRLHRFDDWLEIAELIRGPELGYRFDSVIDEDVKEVARLHFREKLKSHLLPSVEVILDPPARVYVSTAHSTLVSSYKEIFHPFGIQVISSSQAVSLEPVVGVKILVTELRKKAFSRYGIKWPTSYQANVLPSLQGNPAGLPISLEALEETGDAKILANPQIICRSGEEAQFLAGGEIPIRISSEKSADVIWKKYGILLTVKPRADRAGRMSIRLTTEVSTVDLSQVVEGVPGFLTNRIDTHFDLETSRTIALSGLIKNEQGESSAGIPLLSKVPILGALFSSREYREQKTELVILVTPAVLSEQEMESHGTGN